MSISIVLVEPENPDNIGAVARAMKNMGLKDLRLVQPPAAWLEKGKKMAVNAYDLLAKAKSFRTLRSATREMHLTVGTSRRERVRQGYFMPFEEMIEKIQKTGKTKKVAIVFGKESKGLANKDLELCNWFTTIPVSSDYPSINLAQAVMVIAFSLFEKDKGFSLTNELEFLCQKDVRVALARFDEAVRSLDYKPEIADRIAFTFQAIIKRSGLLHSEAQMIKGISRRILERVPKK